jgi:amino acid permease
MDVGGWIGVIALALAIPLGVLSHLLSIRVVSFLEQRKLIKAQKTKEQARRTYERIKAFHEGRRDRHVYYILLGSSSVLLAVAASTIMVVAALISSDVNNTVAAFMVAFLFWMVSVLLLIGIYETARQLERFYDYKKEFEERWGPIDE